MQDTQDKVIKYLKGLPDDASRFDKKLYKRYSAITNVLNKLQYDLKHGATQVDLREFLASIRKDESSLCSVIVMVLQIG